MISNKVLGRIHLKAAEGLDLKADLLSHVKQILSRDLQSSTPLAPTVVFATVVDALEHAKSKSLREVSCYIGNLLFFHFAYLMQVFTYTPTGVKVNGQDVVLIFLGEKNLKLRHPTATIQAAIHTHHSSSYSHP